MNKPTLRFRPDGSFRILQLTDMHLRCDTGRNATALAMISALIEREKPDLVAFTGDITCDGGLVRMLTLTDKINQILESYGTPYTHILGNHESDGDNARLGRHLALADAWEAYPLCLFERGAADMGIGNYTVPIYPHTGGDKPAWMLYHVDCHAGQTYTLSDGLTVREDAMLFPSQLDWLKQTHTALQAQYGSVPSILFDHVPLPEFDDVWMFDGIYGEHAEKVFHAPVNCGLFSLLYELRDFRGVFVGHDHRNSYHGTMFGILLAYGRCSGYQPACTPHWQGFGNAFKRGGRIIDLNETTGQIERTYIAVHDGSKVPEEFTPPIFDRDSFYLPRPDQLTR